MRALILSFTVLLMAVVSGCGWLELSTPETVALRHQIADRGIDELTTAHSEVLKLAEQAVAAERKRAFAALETDFERRAGRIMELAEASGQKPTTAMLRLSRNYASERDRLERELETLARSYETLAAKIETGSKALRVLVEMQTRLNEAEDDLARQLMLRDLWPVAREAAEDQLGQDRAESLDAIMNDLYATDGESDHGETP